MESVQAIIIDNSSAFCKAGFAGETSPKVIVPSIVSGTIHPIQRGVISDWTAMEQLWQQIFQQLKVTPKDYYVVVTDMCGNSPSSARETMAKIMFEKFAVKGLYIANSASLSLFASGKTTGVVVESDDAVTQVVPIKDGQVLQQGVRTWNFGKQDLQGNENKAVDVFFQPKLMEMNHEGVHEMIIDSIANASANTVVQKQLEKNVVLSGSNTLFDGMVERMNKELSQLTQSEVTVVVPSDRKNAVWVGGSILASLPTFQSMWITVDEYKEQGVEIVHKKCK